METHPNGIAPVTSGNYKLGAKGGRMGNAWQYVWDRLDKNDWKGGLELSKEAAEAFKLKPVTVSEMLCRMRASGVIEQTQIPVETKYVRKRGRRDDESDQEYAQVKPSTFVAKRARVHYRIAK